MGTADVFIAGAGIIGLSTAIELAGHGLRVVVGERGEAMSEASWAAAGMLAGRDPENPPELHAMAELSLSLYPGYLDKVELLSGLPVPLRTSGTLQASASDDSFDSALTPEAVTARVPGLIAAGRRFFWLEEQSLDPRDLSAALPRAAVAAGVILIERCAVAKVRSGPAGIEIVTDRERWSAKHFINCAGAWAGSLCSGPPVAPVKGQLLSVKLPPNRALPCVIRTPELYLVPRSDGRVVIGATVEHAGFEKTVSPDAIQTLFEQAAALWPPLREAAIVETWAGLRPRTPDDLPILGPCAQEHCWVASGHFRNGILLAPATARVMSELVLGQQPGVDLTPFRSDRFTASCVHKEGDAALASSK